MKRGMIIWILILVAVVAVVVLTIPGVYCYHEYDKIENCSKLQCKYCGHIKKLKEPEHVVRRTDCYLGVCVKCNAEIEMAEEHLKWCASYDQCYACGKDMTEYKKEHPDYHKTKTVHRIKCVVAECCTICGKDISIRDNHSAYETVERLKDKKSCEIELRCKNCWEVVGTKFHSVRRVKLENGNYIEQCAYCDYIEGDVYHQHTYKTQKCGEKGPCIYCGKIGKSSVTRHNFENPFLRVFDKCTECGKMRYETSKMDWGSRVAEVLSVFLIAFAFQYVVRRRKYMHISWLTVIVMWLTENSCFGSFSPAVLWKKKLD